MANPEPSSLLTALMCSCRWCRVLNSIVALRHLRQKKHYEKESGIKIACTVAMTFDNRSIEDALL